MIGILAKVLRVFEKHHLWEEGVELIAPRRSRLEKRAKDYEQALHIVPVLKKERLREVYLNLPKAWRKRILQSLKQADQYAPLLEEQSTSLVSTLQGFE